jgi:serine/threonine protein kinase
MAIDQLKQSTYDHTVDIWATGIILYIILSGGKHPVYLPDMSGKEYSKHIMAQQNWIFPDYFPLLGRNLFLKLCKSNGIYRYECHKALNHPWIIRSHLSSIPLTLFESYAKESRLREFRTV